MSLDEFDMLRWRIALALFPSVVWILPGIVSAVIWTLKSPRRKGVLWSMLFELVGGLKMFEVDMCIYLHKTKGRPTYCLDAHWRGWVWVEGNFEDMEHHVSGSWPSGTNLSCFSEIPLGLWRGLGIERHYSFRLPIYRSSCAWDYIVWPVQENRHSSFFLCKAIMYPEVSNNLD